MARNVGVGFLWMSIYSRGQASLARVNRLLVYQPRIYDGQQVLTKTTEIRVKNLVLNDQLTSNDNKISFCSEERGQLLGIVGPSGSFKTTLLKIVYRRILAPSSTIFYDESDINDLALESIYQQVSVVMQEPFLFHKSIRENICFAKPDATDEEIWEVVNLVNLDKDFMRLKAGIDTMIGERGVTLSGGQRQRVALARALLPRRSVLILDDALSAVDTDTERHIVSGLSSFFDDRIVIIATNRLSALRNANHILVLEHGRVVDEGRHEHLEKKSLLYKSLWGIEQ